MVVEKMRPVVRPVTPQVEDVLMGQGNRFPDPAAERTRARKTATVGGRRQRAASKGHYPARHLLGRQVDALAIGLGPVG